MHFTRSVAALALLSLAACAENPDAACQGDAVIAALTKGITEKAITGAQQMADHRMRGSGATLSAFRSVADRFELSVTKARVIEKGPGAARRCAGRLSITVPEDVLTKADNVAAMLGKGDIQALAKAENVDLKGTTFRTDVDYSIAGDDGGAVVEPERGTRFVGLVRDLLVAAVLDQHIRSEYDAIREEEQVRADARAMAEDPDRADELAELLERERQAHAEDDADGVAAAAERAAAASEAAVRGL